MTDIVIVAAQRTAEGKFGGESRRARFHEGAGIGSGAQKSVTVNTISPGYIGTKMVTAIPKEVLDSKILPHIPVGRLGKSEEVAGLIIYLAFEEAAFVTGANIAVNGGQHMQ